MVGLKTEEGFFEKDSWLKRKVRKFVLASAVNWKERKQGHRLPEVLRTNTVEVKRETINVRDRWKMGSKKLCELELESQVDVS
jgi:hypothetical protein